MADCLTYGNPYPLNIGSKSAMLSGAMLSERYDSYRMVDILNPLMFLVFESAKTHSFPAPQRR